ncbi:MAG: hypothetical protein LBB78_08110, partial [Spirochaetaceae bacterium]|nr:hypothetical protein [Spirochaetaceae bacterium]
MKRIGMLTILCGMAALILGGCAVPLGEDFAIPRDTEEEKGLYIVDYSLQNYVPVPVTGEQAVKKVALRGDLEGTVTWKDEFGNELPNLGTFLADTVYQAEIKLTSQKGYLFNPSIDFGYHAGKIEYQEDKHAVDDQGNPIRIVTVTYNNSNDGKITYITDYNLQNYVPFPVADQNPVWSIDTEGLTGTVTWNVEGGTTPLVPPEKFQAGKKYTADISLEVQAGYKFSPKRDFLYDDGLVAVQPNSNREPFERDLTTVTYKDSKKPVSNLDLTSYITAPKEGNTPVTAAFTDPQYTAAEVRWDP